MQGARLFQNGLLRHKCLVICGEEPVRRTLVWPSLSGQSNPAYHFFLLRRISLTFTPIEF